jgi:hypothetical protein
MRSVAGIAVFLMAGAAWAQDGELKAREAFWIKAPQAKPSTPQATPKTTPKKTNTPGTTKNNPPQPEPQREPQANNNPPQTPERPGGAHTAKVEYSQIPLALRYSILQKQGDRYLEVDPQTEFHTDDRVRVRVEANDTGYLYIVMQGSSGQWAVLFPNPDINGGNNKVEAGHSYTIPPDKDPAFRFDGPAGVEHVSLILSRTPETDMEKLIYAADDHNRTVEKPRMTIARNTVEESAFGQVRNDLLSRDLVFDKYDESKHETTPDGKPDKAGYAATKDKGPDARLYVELPLTHK